MSIIISSTRICSISPSFPPRHQGLDDWTGINNVFVNSQLNFPCIHYASINTYFAYGVHYKAKAMSDSQSYSPDQEDSNEKEDTQQEHSWSTTKILKQLKRYGVSGILSYGLLNTAYYLTTFLTVWFYFAPAPGKMGYLAAVSRFLKVMAMVWAGSQVTKLIRAAGALALAPIVDKGLSWFTVKFKFQSRTKAFFTIVGFCFGLAVILFLIVTLLSA